MTESQFYCVSIYPQMSMHLKLKIHSLRDVHATQNFLLCYRLLDHDVISRLCNRLYYNEAALAPP
jgi:hypothetical protein